MLNGNNGSQKVQNYCCLVAGVLKSLLMQKANMAELKLTLVVTIFVSLPSTKVVSHFCCFVPVLLLSAGSVPKA